MELVLLDFPGLVEVELLDVLHLDAIVVDLVDEGLVHVVAVVLSDVMSQGSLSCLFFGRLKSPYSRPGHFEPQNYGGVFHRKMTN